MDKRKKVVVSSLMLDGFCLEDFRNVVIRMRRNMPETVRENIRFVEEHLIKEDPK